MFGTNSSAARQVRDVSMMKCSPAKRTCDVIQLNLTSPELISGALIHSAEQDLGCGPYYLRFV